MPSSNQKPRRQVHLGAYFPGVNATTVWSDPASGSNIDFASFVHLAQTAERAKFDFFFLAEGLRLREKRGLIHDLDVVGRPDTLTVLAGLAAVTERLGLIGTINATYNEPYEVARQFATLDQLSTGRAGWNVVTSSDAFFGENFRRGGYLPYAERYQRAGELLDVHGRFNVPQTPQVEPVILQAGDSEEARDFGAEYADAIFTLARPIDDARFFYQELKDRLALVGRSREDLLILPGVTFALGSTTKQAAQNAEEIRRAQVSGATALQFVESVWNRDLSEYDPDGPLPQIDPDPGPLTISQGTTRHTRDPLATAKEWRELAEARKLSIRELAIELSARQTFVGTPSEVAAQIDERVQTRAADGFILVPHLSPDEPAYGFAISGASR
jgi:alkanesulfonate monooxygenase SsuD/methylene tetrahydromethanopterin reductase-like flavin-dependent oxidoreductase (luciferase family)